MTRHAEREPGLQTSGDGVSGISEGRFRAVLANVADMVTISDRDGRTLYASPATEKVSGYTPEEFVTRHPFDAIHPEDRPRCEEVLESVSWKYLTPSEFSAATARGDGRGLGLGSMRERVEMAGGELRLISHPGDGTTMEMRVPLRRHG
jgi:PAS domain S-box-containing protein